MTKHPHDMQHVSDVMKKGMPGIIPYDDQLKKAVEKQEGQMIRVFVFKSERVESNAVIAWDDFQILMELTKDQVRYDLVVHLPKG